MESEVNHRNPSFGQSELHGRGTRIDDADDGLPGLHTFVTVDVFALDDAGERRTQLGVFQHIERIFVDRLRLRITGTGGFELLLRNGLMFQQSLHTGELRPSLLES